MKKSLAWIVLLGVALSFSSCKDDEDPAPAIAGEWLRNTYEFTQLQSGFQKYWEGYQVTSFGESNYLIVVRADGTYTRFFTVESPYNLNDTGKWTLDGTSFKLTPDKSSDIDLADNLFWPGTEFTVSGEINDTRLTLTRVVTLSLFSDAKLDAVGGDTSQLTDDDREPVDVTVVYKFDKVK